MAHKNKTFKITGIIIGTIIIIGIIIYALIGLVLKPYIKDKIRNNVQTFGEVKYDIDFEDMDLQIFTGNIYVNKLQITPQKDPLNITEDNYKLIIEKLSLLGFNFWALIDKDNYEVDQIKIDEGTVSVYKYVNDQPDTIAADDPAPAEIGAIKIGSINIDKSHFIIYNLGENAHNPLFTGNISLSVDDIYYKFGPKWAEDLRYNSLTTSMTDLHSKSTDSLRIFNVKSVKINGDNNSHHARADGFSIRTRSEKEKFSEILGKEGDWIDMHIASVELEKWQIRPMLLNLSLNAFHLKVNDPKVLVFRDKRYPDDNSKTFQLPYDFLRDLKTNFSIDTINISGGSITYQEHVKAMDEAGEINFENFNATLKNFTNDSSTLEQNGRKAYMHVNTDIMNAAPLKADFIFNLVPNATHSVKGNLGQMELTALNPMISKVGYVKIERGVCQSIDFNFTYDDQKSQGEVIFKYNNLEIETISQNDGDEDSFGQEIKSLIADFIIDDENEDGDLRVGTISYTRNKNRSTINYWWKSLLTGLKSSLGLPGKVKS